MKIERLEVRPLTLTLAEPYAVAYQSFNRVEAVLVRIVTAGRETGAGCAASDVAVTGESPAATRTALEEVAAPALAGRDASRPGWLLERLRRPLAGRPAALAAVDIALHDLQAKRAGLPVWKLLGGYRDRIATSVTIGILPAAETVERARHWVAQGFRCLKIKGGLDAEADAERVAEVRAAVGGRVRLRFDANQGFDVDQTLGFVAATAGAALELIEQPVARGDLEALARITREVPLPVAADESLIGLRDSFRLARGERADVLNVKLMKAGGIAEASRTAAVARAAGLEVMAGCMDEPELGIAAALAFALSTPDVAYADLDGHLGLEGDPTAGAVRLAGGTLRPSRRPGLGCDLDDWF